MNLYDRVHHRRACGRDGLRETLPSRDATATATSVAVEIFPSRFDGLRGYPNFLASFGRSSVSWSSDHRSPVGSLKGGTVRGGIVSMRRRAPPINRANQLPGRRTIGKCARNPSVTAY